MTDPITITIDPNGEPASSQEFPFIVTVTKGERMLIAAQRDFQMALDRIPWLVGRINQEPVDSALFPRRQ